jgi:hypothetical protein
MDRLYYPSRRSPLHQMKSGPRQVPHVLRAFSGRKHQSADPSVVNVDDELAQHSSGVGPLRVNEMGRSTGAAFIRVCRVPTE